MALEPPETGRWDATARARDVTNRIDTFPGPATVAEFLCFYFFFLAFVSSFYPKKSWIGTGLEFPLLFLDEEDGTLPRKERDRDTLRASRTTWSSVIESVQYYPRKTRVFIFPVPIRRRWMVRLSPDGSRVSMFLFCFLSLTHYPHLHQPERMHCAHTHTLSEEGLRSEPVTPCYRNRTRDRNRMETNARKRPLPSNPGLVFLSQLRSGSHNQPSFCVFLLFFSYFQHPLPNTQYSTNKTTNNPPEIGKVIIEVGKKEREVTQTQRERIKGRQ